MRRLPMRRLRLLTVFAGICVLSASGCCRWWCNNCERFCSRGPQPVPMAVPAQSYAPAGCVPCAPVCCPQPVGYPTPGYPAPGYPTPGYPPTVYPGAPISGQWQRPYYGSFDDGCP